jgi:hypothetical protein
MTIVLIVLAVKRFPGTRAGDQFVMVIIACDLARIDNGITGRINIDGSIAVVGVITVKFVLPFRHHLLYSSPWQRWILRPPAFPKGKKDGLK